MNSERRRLGPSVRPAGDRRWEDRRQTADPVPADRRTGSDRRDPMPQESEARGLDWLDRVSQTLQRPRRFQADQNARKRDRTVDALAAPGGDTLVTARHGIIGTVYAAWERVVEREQDGARYRVFHGTLYRQIGSGALQPQSLAAVDDLFGTYEDVYGRAYALIYARHPALRARGHQRDGTIIILDNLPG